MTRITMAKPEHQVAYQDLTALVAKHKDRVSALELLAIASNMVGKMIALQDQRAHTPAQIMNMVATNVEAGNREAIEQVLSGALRDGPK